MKRTTKAPRKPLPAGIAKVLKRLPYPLEGMLQCVRWYVADSLSARDLEEMVAERDVPEDHSTIHRWVTKWLPVFETATRRRLRPVGDSWRMDETNILVRGQGKYLYRAVDKAGHTIDFVLRARRFFGKAIAARGTPKTVTVDKSGANRPALQAPGARRHVSAVKFNPDGLEWCAIYRDEARTQLDLFTADTAGNLIKANAKQAYLPRHLQVGDVCCGGGPCWTFCRRWWRGQGRAPPPVP